MIIAHSTPSPLPAWQVLDLTHMWAGLFLALGFISAIATIAKVRGQSLLPVLCVLLPVAVGGVLLGGGGEADQPPKDPGLPVHGAERGVVV